MQRIRQWGIVALSTALIVACVLWIFYFPFRPAQVLRVVPPEAVVVTWHCQPAARIDELLKSELTALILAAANLKLEDAAAVLEEPGVQELVKRLGGTGVTLAYASVFGGRREPALILGAWVGGVTTHWMRAGLMDRSFEGYAVHRIGRDRIWIGFFPDLPYGMRYISFGVFEGVLAGCASSDPFAAASLLAALRRHGEVPPLVSAWVDRRGALKKEYNTAPDIFRGYALKTPENTVISTGDFRLLSNGTLTVRMQLEETGEPSALPAFFGKKLVEENEKPIKALFPLPDDVPALLVATTVARGVISAAALPPVWRQRLLLEPLSALAAPGATCLAWISGGTNSGRIMRMKVPGVGFAMQIPPDMRVETAAARATDIINSTYGVGLIAVPDRKDRRIFAFQPVKGAGILRAEEYPAMAVTDGWLIAMTNVEALRRLMGQVAGLPPQSVETGDLSSLWLYGSTRLPEAAEAASNAMAGYALMRLMQTGRAERLDTPVVRRLLQAMVGMGAVSLRAGHDSSDHFMAVLTMDPPGGSGHE